MTALHSLESPALFRRPHAPSPHPVPLQLARRIWYSMRRCWWSAYFHLDVRGARNVPKAGPMLLCANHSSHLDAAAILAALPRELALQASTAAARDVFAGRWWRDLFSRLTTGALPVQREADFAKGLRTLERVLTDRRPLVLFPEGKRSQTGELLPFKSGAAMLAIRTGAPIVPIHLSGVTKALPKGSVLLTAADVTVRFGEPIDATPYVRAIEEGRVTRKEAYAALTHEMHASIVEMMETM